MINSNRRENRFQVSSQSISVIQSLYVGTASRLFQVGAAIGYYRSHARACACVKLSSLSLFNSPVVSQMVKVTLDPTASTAATVVCFSNDVDLYTCGEERRVVE